MLLLPSFFDYSVADFPDDWAVETGDKFYYTTGFDFNINLPQELWNNISATIWEALNSSYNQSMGFPLPPEEKAEFDAKAIFLGISALPSLFHIELEVTGTDTVREMTLEGNYVDYDVINVTAKVKLPSDPSYIPIEDFSLNYLEYYVNPFITESFPTTLALNYTGEITKFIENRTAIISNASYQYEFDNRAIVNWAEDTNQTLSEFQETLLHSFGILEHTFEFPAFVQKDADFGLAFEATKDEINRNLIQSPLIFMGGINGMIEEIGLEIIVSEKEAYFSWGLESPEDLIDEILDVAEFIGIDQINMLLNTTDYNFRLDKDTLQTDFEAAVRWSDEGILQNIHYEMDASNNLISSEYFGIHFVVDISEGISSSLGSKYTGKPNSPKIYDPVVTEDWAVTEGSKNEFTAGYNFNLELPQAVWDILDKNITDMLNSTYNLTEGETIDSKVLYNSIVENIPKLINFEAEVTDMFQYEYEVVEYNETTLLDDIVDRLSYDVLISKYRMKLPSESSYRPPGTFLEDIYNALLDTVGDGFPESVANNLTATLEDFEENLMNSTSLGDYNISFLDIAFQFVPSKPAYWGTSNTAEGMPSFLNDLGLYGNSTLNTMVSSFGTPSTLYMPKNTNFESIYDGYVSFIAEQEGIALNEVGEYLSNMSIDRIEFKDKEAYLEWEIDGLSDRFWEGNTRVSQVNSLCSVFNDSFGIELDNDSIRIVFNTAIRYSDEGILENDHMQFEFSIETTTGDLLSFALESDISYGDWDKWNEKFYGEPLITIYDHWREPDTQFTFSFDAGNNQQCVLESEEYNVDVTIDYSSSGAGTLSIQAWTSNPISIPLDFVNSSLFLAIEVSDNDILEFPLTITIDLPNDLLEFTDEDIIENFQIFTLDEPNEEWILEDFIKTIDRDEKEISIEITHLSVFAIGYIPEKGFWEKIPGYPSFALILASLGSIFYLTKHRK
jgi:hypothetical protein